MCILLFSLISNINSTVNRITIINYSTVTEVTEILVNMKFVNNFGFFNPCGLEEETKEIASTSLFLCSGQASCITGA